MKSLIQTLLFCLMFTQINAQCQQQQDYFALRALYLSTNGDNWTNNTGWLTEAEFIINPNMPVGTNVDIWYGVTTNMDGCVTDLNLTSNQLSGSIPPEIGNLDNLTQLWLDYNDLSGNIPPEIGNLNNLIQLRLSSNNLSGSIPLEIGNLNNLTQLWLYYNDLSGSIPPELGNLNSLIVLNLSSNELSGSIPPELENLDNLTQLSLSLNDLSGSIPPELENLNNLEWLYLDSNDLSGSIPPELGNLDSLTVLYLSSNELSGSIPLELGNLNKLRHLVLSSNELSGSIPIGLGNLNNLELLHLPFNNLSGSIPPELGNLNNLIHLYLSSNELSGSIPSEIGNLNNLIELGLHSNDLSGCYDSNLFSLCVQLNSTSSTNTSISDGNNFDAPWEVFCATGVNTCDIPNVVLPGNFDNNAIVNGKDLLYWGAAYDYTGPTRSNATIEWIPQHNTEDWATSVDGVNSKHQDANGDGIVDTLDIEAFELNCGKTYGIIDTFECHSTDTMFVIEALEVDTVLKKIRFELHIASDMPISTHGISTTIDLSANPQIYDVQIDTIGSSLHPDIYIDKNNGDNIIDIALTRTDKNNQIIDGLVVSLVVMVKDIQSLIIYVNKGYAMSATGVLTSIGGTTVYYYDSLSTPVFLEVNHAYNDEMGTAEVYTDVEYSCVWSTGETTTSIEDLDVGNYNVTVSDGIDTMVIDFEIADECPTPDSFDVSTSAPPVTPPLFSAYLINSLGETPRLTYELDKYGAVDINLYNTHGQRLRTIYKAKSGAGDYQIDIDKGNLPRGIYFIHIQHQSDDYIRSKTLKILI